MERTAPQTQPAPDLRHIRTWIFDLDNTLYAAHGDVFPQIERRMGEFVGRLLRLEAAEARTVQKALYRAHGTTLNGLIKEHGVDPEAFLDYVHDIDLSSLAPQPLLTEGIARLPGRRFVFTNGCRHHAGRVLERLAIAPLFDGIWDIRACGFVPKPDAAAYARVVAQAGVAPRLAAMFDDIAGNLVPAHALGMTTIWLDTGAPWSKEGPAFPVESRAAIDHETTDLGHFLHSIRV
ncbi:MAG TPA: pyrimidine 5'-nucleotidase [Rhizomicrobium sp.]|jgi:putative hydrolase of the HAD superfamily|nr:pyrimidine 5'-nucleotidase [Rhizomicrobium sp.]